MIDNSIGTGIWDVCRIFGSVLPRTLIWGILGAAEGFLLDYSDFQLFKHRNGPGGDGPGGEEYLDLWHHPYSVHVFGMVIGFSLVMYLTPRALP